MTTALDLITRGMRLAGVIGKGELPDEDEAADGLTALNDMLDSWSTERMYAYYIVEETLTLVAAQATYTMGTGGDLNTTRPTRIEDSCFIRYASMDTPLTLINNQAYAAIVAKTIQSNIPDLLFADMQYPLVRLSFYPTPSTSSAVAHIMSWKQLQQFTALTTSLSMPPGSKRAIAYSLAEEFGPEFGANIQPIVIAIAQKARANLKRINAPNPVMRSEVGAMTSHYPPGNVRSG